MKSASLLLLCLLLSVIVGCKPDVPSKYLQPDELENILYDYHVADAMAAGVSVADGEQAYAYRLAGLKNAGRVRLVNDFLYPQHRLAARCL